MDPNTRVEINRALAKALAFKQVGNDREAKVWALRLVELLECEDILDPTIPRTRPLKLRQG